MLPAWPVHLLSCSDVVELFQPGQTTLFDRRLVNLENRFTLAIVTTRNVASLGSLLTITSLIIEDLSLQSMSKFHDPRPKPLPLLVIGYVGVSLDERLDLILHLVGTLTLFFATESPGML